MASKIMDMPGIGQVTFRRRKGSRSIRLRIDVHGKVVVTLPYFVPYRTAAAFVIKQQGWIETQQTKHQRVFVDGMSIGRAHRLRLIYDETALRPRTRVTQTEAIVWHSENDGDKSVQSAAKKAATQALKQEAFLYLPKRLKDIATAEGYEYSGMDIKSLRGRWGSCNQDKHITLNIFLMELPSELIDYVIYHELAHTRHLNHSPNFWSEFEAHLPDAKARRKQIREYQPTVPSRSR